ncbi:phosphomannomutase/phosphoglucomutase, partial [Leifsonia sp. SIMBA_070]
PAAVARVRSEFERDGVTVDALDGLTFTSDDGQWWFNLRASNTEPFLRLNAEAEDLPTMVRVRDRVLELVRN